jgi:hypothetical protein
MLTNIFACFPYKYEIFWATDCREHRGEPVLATYLLVSWLVV